MRRLVGRRHAALAALAALTLVAGCAPHGVQPDRPIATPPAPPGPVDPVDPPLAGTPPLRIVFVDVGQGDAIVILTGAGKAVLIDAGTKGKSSRVIDVLRAHGVERLDLAVMTHAHNDHMGGFSEVLKRFGARFFLDPGVDHGSKVYLRLLQFLEQRQIPVKLARKGRRIDLGGGVMLQVLAPTDPLQRGTRSDVNSNSVVVRVTLGNFSALLAGDAEAPTERRLLAQPEFVVAKVLKVAHHGGRHSTSREWLAAVRPEIAVISVSARNRYGHPTEETLGRLDDVKAKVYRTDLHGSVTVTTDGQTWTVKTQRVPEPSVSSAPAPRSIPGHPRGPPPATAAAAP